MSDLLKRIDARTKLAGTNKLEILLFSLGMDQRTGRKEIFGINVFKVREVMRTPEITTAPEMQASVEGMVSLRGQLVPVIDLAKYTGIITDKQPEIMIVTEYNGHTQGFLVEAVDTRQTLAWREGRLVLDDLPLSKALPLINRYLDAPLVLGDQASADQRQGHLHGSPQRSGEQRHFLRFEHDDLLHGRHAPIGSRRGRGHAHRWPCHG